MRSRHCSRTAAEGAEEGGGEDGARKWAFGEWHAGTSAAFPLSAQHCCQRAWLLYSDDCLPLAAACRDRLASKLLTGSVVAAAVRDLNAAEGELRREKFSNRW